MTFDKIALLALIAAMSAALVWVNRRERDAVRRQRAALFDACLPHFEDCRVTQDGVDFPVLEGRFRGRRVLLEPLVDAVNVRKLPVLWLRVTLLEPARTPATVSLLVRPQGTEFWSPSAELSHRAPIPSGWPEHALLRSDREDVGHLFARLGPHVAAFFPDLQAKEMVISPRGVRLVYQLDQARRSNYLVLRTALFDQATLTPDLLIALVERAFAIRDEFDRNGDPPQETRNAD